MDREKRHFIYANMAPLLRDESKKIDFIRDLQEVMRRYR